MKTIQGVSLDIAPGERAIMFMPIPPGTDVERLDVDPPTAAHFRILRADLISVEECQALTGVPGPAVRLELENASDRSCPARMFVDVEIAREAHQRSLEQAAEAWNRQAFALRTAPSEAERARIVAEIMAGRVRRGGGLPS